MEGKPRLTRSRCQRTRHVWQRGFYPLLGKLSEEYHYWTEERGVAIEFIDGQPAVPRWTIALAFHPSSLMDSVLRFVAAQHPDAAHAIWTAAGDLAVIRFAFETFCSQLHPHLSINYDVWAGSRRHERR